MYPTSNVKVDSDDLSNYLMYPTSNEEISGTICYSYESGTKQLVKQRIVSPVQWFSFVHHYHDTSYKAGKLMQGK